MSYARYKGKIGYCDNKYLKGLMHLSGGHYVYIKSIDGNGFCLVHIITSLEDRNKQYTLSKIKQVKKGNIYPLPIYDSNFTLWSGINHSLIRVHINFIKNIGVKRIRDIHKFYIGKKWQ